MTLCGRILHLPLPPTWNEVAKEMFFGGQHHYLCLYLQPANHHVAAMMALGSVDF
jgi:hypothetical protein